MINHFDAPDQFDAFDDRDVDLDESNEAPDVCAGCLNKAAIADVLYEKYKIDRGNGKRLASQIFELIINNLKEGHTVKLAGLGNFSVRDKTARPGRNLKTGSLVVIEERRVVNFRPSGTLNRRVSDQRAGRAPKKKRFV